MPREVIMPKVDMDMASGKLIAWHVAEGQHVARGDVLFDIETDKAAMEVEAEASGTLYHLIAPGTDVVIGAPVAWLYEEGEAPPSPGTSPPGTPETDSGAQKTQGTAAHPAAEGTATRRAAEGSARTDRQAPGAKVETAPGAAVQVAAPLETAVAMAASGPAALSPQPGTAFGVPEAPEAPVDAGQSPDSPGVKPRATPAARALARRTGAALHALAGSGPNGRVQVGDVEAWARDRTAAPDGPGAAVLDSPLAVTRHGASSGVPVVFLHGFAGSSLGWAPLGDLMLDRPQIRIDLPSHGKSPQRRVASFAALVAEIRRAVTALDLDQFDLVGHSLGGALALALADTRPRKLRQVTLLAPAGLGPEINGPALSGICRATRAESLAPWLRTLVADDRLVTDAFARFAMAEREDPALRAAQTALAEVLFPDGIQAFDLRAALHRVGVPTRMVWGKRDAIIPWQHALQAPGRTALHLFDGIGHVPQLEAPNEIGNLVNLPL